MRVFNKEVKGCHECSYNAAEGQCGETWCKFIYKDTDNLDLISPIHKECPFNKPITKESFKEVGLKLISDKNNWCEFRNDKCDLYVNLDFQKPTHLNIHSRGHSFIGNCKPKVNNPEELEFILRSIGVIK
jgi:hypothetical protein